MRERPRVGKRPGPWALRCLAFFGPALACCGCAAPNAKVTPQERLDLEHRARDLLVRAAQSDDSELSCNAIEALVKVAPDEGLPGFRVALRSPAPLVRCAGLKALGTLRDRQSATVYRQLLNDPHPLVRLAAAFAAVRSGDTQAARTLVSTLNDHPEERVRAEAADLLGRLEEPRARKHLQAALRVKANQRSSIVRMEIYTALARIGDKDAMQHLIEHSQGDALSRLVALQSLAELATEDARAALEFRMSPQEDYVVHRLIAARGLARLGDPAGYKLASENLRYVGKNADDPEEAVRIRVNAALVLGEIGDARALGALKTMAETESDPRLQVAACYAICRILKH